VTSVRDERFDLPRKTGCHGTGVSTVEGLRPGAYTVDVAGPRPGGPIAPVSADVLIWDSAS
jgi:hypothetical protein